METNNSAKILLLDIETSPCKAYIWSLWQDSVNYDALISEWYILCWSAKWLGSKEIISYKLTDFKEYKNDPENDFQLMQKMWELLDEADICVSQNGSRFDHKKINTRFMKHGMTPPSPFKVIDTLIAAKKGFAFTSNKLDSLSQFLGLGKKMDTGGFELWKRCLDGDLKAFEKMQKYCSKDVKLLEKVYLKLRPYIAKHPNANIYNNNDTPVCPKCGKNKIQKRGFAFTTLGKYQRYVCLSCGSWGRGRSNLLSKEKRKSLTSNIV